MPNAEQAAERTFDALQEALEGPPPVHVNNINIDVHSGAAPQRPYAVIEDQLARVVAGYPTHELLRRALPPGEKITQREDGIWVREVEEHTGRQFTVNGRLVNEKRKRQRGVSLSAADARTSSTPALEFDNWNGFCWVRRGVKPEKDFAVMAHQPVEEELFYEDASPADQAILQHQLARTAMAVPQAEELPSERAPRARKGD